MYTININKPHLVFMSLCLHHAFYCMWIIISKDESSSGGGIIHLKTIRYACLHIRALTNEKYE